MNYLISGGGTGGHIFPAVSIANALRELQPDCKILFVGALGRMEMERVPQAGYDIVGLPIRGFYRKQVWKNISVLWDLMRSMIKARRIVRDFRPDVGIGVGGYASGAAMKMAAKMGVPILLQEQNGFAGVTNKLLKNDAKKICVAYDGMERFFPKDKLILTGNPVRQNLVCSNKAGAYQYFELDPAKKTILIIGGSLGARTINESIIQRLQQIQQSDIQIIWQTGKVYYDKCKQSLDQLDNHNNIYCSAFLSRMDFAYAAADLVISRAGASSISELCLLGKAAILVPSPNVAENHQYHNARALSDKQAAILILDDQAQTQLVDTAMQLLKSPEELQSLQQNILTLAQHDSAIRIAQEVIKLAQH